MTKRGGIDVSSTAFDQLDRIKRLAIVAMFSDDDLMERLVLKGGNALDLVHRVSARASVDVDFSMGGDFPQSEFDAYRERVRRAPETTFELSRYRVFDVNMELKPPNITPEQADFWGGYGVEFKLIRTEDWRQRSADIDTLRKAAIRIGQGQKFTIDISRYEYVDDAEERDFEGYRIRVYSPLMIVCEKLRSICQQMQEYSPVVRRNRAGAPRARDFVDIHSVVENKGVDLASPEDVAVLRRVFEAKRVPPALLGRIRSFREFHEQDFAAVRSTAKPGAGVRDDFRFYFDYVVELAERLKTLWNE